MDDYLVDFLIERWEHGVEQPKLGRRERLIKLSCIEDLRWAKRWDEGPITAAERLSHIPRDLR